MQVSQEAVSLKINDARLVKNLGFAFTNKTTVLAELLQNGRRAGATKIRLSFDAEAKTLCVIDNGLGIEQLQHLLTVAESGWDATIQEEEKPFGMGFLSALFAATHIRIESGGRKMEIDTALALDFGSFPVMGTDFIGGTRILLSGFDLTLSAVEKAVAEYAKGFPVDIFLNEVLQAAPHRIDTSQMVAVEQGHIRLGTVKKLQVYLQGLPVYQDKHYDSEASVVHLDSKLFHARMPDRDKLIDEVHVLEVIRKQIQVEWFKALTVKKQELSAEVFATKYWELARMFGILEIMVDVPVIPRCELWDMTEYPESLRFEQNGLTLLKDAVTKAQVESGEVVLCTGIASEMEGLCFATTMFAYKKGWVVSYNAWPEGHWVIPYIKVLALLTPELVYTPLAQGNFSGNFVTADLVCCEEYQIIVEGESVTITDEALAFQPEGTGCYSDSVTIVVPTESDGAEALAQASAYMDDGDYMESEHDDDMEGVRNQVTMLRGEPAADTMLKVLVDGGVSQFNNVLGGLFLVQVRGSRNRFGRDWVQEATPVLDVLQAAKAWIEQAGGDTSSVLPQLDAVLSSVTKMRQEMEQASIKHEQDKALDYLKRFSPQGTVAEVYDEDEKFQSAVACLIPTFEYPDWSGETVGALVKHATKLRSATA